MLELAQYSKTLIESCLVMPDEIRVLLIDDEQNQYYLIQGYLNHSKTHSFHIDWTASIDEAFALVTENAYDVCLLDYELGERNGIEVLERFRELEIDVPVIVITGYGSHDIDLAVMEAGAVDFIDKTTLNADILDRVIRYTVQQYHQTVALRQSEIRFRAMVEKGSDLIIQMDGQGRIIYTSPSISRILGYEENELLEQTLLDLVHKEDLPIIAQMFNKLTTLPQNPPVASYRIRSQDGQWKWFETVATNLLRVAGIGAIIVNARDITDRRQLLMAEQEQRSIAQALLDTSNALNSTLNFDDVLSRILENLGNVIPHCSASVMLIDENDTTYAASYRGYDYYNVPVSLDDFCFDIHQTHSLNTMMKTRAPYMVADVQQNSSWTQTETAVQIRSYIGIPIVETDKVIGFINLDSDVSDHFTQKHADYLQLFANQAAIAIRNAHQFRQAQQLAAIEERQRLARELHDAVSQTLFSASVIADSLTRVVDSDKQKLQAGLEKLTQLNRSALAEMRSLLVELRPQAIVSTPLPDLLRNLANSIRGRTSITVELEVIGSPIELEPDVHLQFYRLAQEILTNAQKHAHAQHIHIEMRYLKESIDLAIADDGIGFDMSLIPPDHHGIRIMHERTARIGAALSIESDPDEGTYIHIKWPSD